MKEGFSIEPVQNKSLSEKKTSLWGKAARGLAVAAVLTTAGAEAAREKKEEAKKTDVAPEPPKVKDQETVREETEIKPRATELPEEIFVPEEKETARLALDWKTDDPQFFVKHKNGEYTATERIARRRVLPNGEKLLVDAGVVFYLVENGDTIFDIKKKLSCYDDFKYLAKQKPKIKSFNIPPTALQPGMWIPIPLEERERVLAEEKFVEYADAAIDEMKADSRYGRFVNQLLETISEDELLATMLAVAKQESGGAPLGQFEFHRYEKRHKAFSFSLFHVLMKGAGLEARRNLDLTEGQLYHPKNAAKLFLAFLFEKMNAAGLSDAALEAKIKKLFPIHKKAHNFSVFYNGKLYWKAGYNKKILKHREDAVRIVEKLER